MIDPLQQAERTMLADPDDLRAGVEVIRKRLRRGEMSRERVERAARLGHAAARAYTGLCERAEHDLGPGIWLLSEREQGLIAADFAEHVLPVFEREYPDDMRARQAIKASRLFACGLIDRESLTRARDSARAADWAAFSLRAANAVASAAQATVSPMGAARAAAWAADNREAERAYQRALLAAYLMGEAKLWTPP